MYDLISVSYELFDNVEKARSIHVLKTHSGRLCFEYILFSNEYTFI